jgi:membrane protein YqaA with SNARE-associated domain
MSALGWGILGLASSAFLSATLLPGNSELALLAFLYRWPEGLWLAMSVATIANTGGSIITMGLARYFVPKKQWSNKIEYWFKQYGASVLVLSWVPMLGDALPLAAGWLRLSWLPCVIWLSVGKGIRYLVIAYFMFHIQ